MIRVEESLMSSNNALDTPRTFTCEDDVILLKSGGGFVSSW